MAAVVVRSGHFRDMNHTVRVLSNLNEQRASSRFCDVVLRINNEQIFAHSNVLAAASPYFGSFLGLGQDSPRAFCQKNPQIIEIHIDSTDGDSGYGEAVRHVVDFMYTCSIELNSKIITQVVEIARIMQLHRVLEFCDRFQKGETGNMPLSKGTGMAVGMSDLSLTRKLRKANAATETELTMFQKSAGVPVSCSVSVSSGASAANSPKVHLRTETGSSELPMTQQCATSTDSTTSSASEQAGVDTSAFGLSLPTDMLNTAQSDAKVENPIGITVSLGTDSALGDDQKPGVITVGAGGKSGQEMVMVKNEMDGDKLQVPVAELPQPTDLNPSTGVPGEIKEEKPVASSVIPVSLTLPVPDPVKSKPPATRGRKPKRGRRGRKRKPREVLSDSDTEFIQETGEDDIESVAAGSQSQLSAEDFSLTEKDTRLKLLKVEEVKDSGTSEADTSQENVSASTSTTDLPSSTGAEVEGIDNKEEATQPPSSRTRGRKPITSVMASWSSPRRRAGIPRSVFKSDYVMHSLVRRTRHGGGIANSPLLPSAGHSEEEDAENLETCEALSKSGSVPGSLGMESTLKFVCQTCDFTTASFRLYRQHMKRHPETDTRSYTCTECNFHTTKARDLLQHRKRHLHEELICSFCEVQLDTAENFQQHLQQHAHSLPYFCHSCDMRFKTRTQLTTHLPKHMTERPFVCQVCGNGFKWKHALKNHMVTHSATKDHLCDICGFATAHKSQLKAHRLIHTGDTFKCPEPGCHFEATKRQNLKYHMVTHTQEKAHQCEVCGQAFSLIKNMRRHMLLHGDTRPYYCSQCSYTSTRFDKLKEHKLKQHGIGQPPGKKMKYGATTKDMKYAPSVKEILEIPGTVAAGLASGTMTLMEDGSVVRAGCEGLQIVEPITIAQDGNNITIRSDVTLTEEALQTIAQIATSSSETATDGTQPQEAHVNIGTSGGFPIIARVQFTSNLDTVPAESDVVSYEEHVE